MTFEATGPDGGDYDGWTSVHASRDGAVLRVFDKIAELGADPRGDDVAVIAANDADNGSTSADLETANGWKISYGVHVMPVEP
jgi:hypothetical protein